MMNDPLEELQEIAQDHKDSSLAQENAPLLRFDRAEPFFPLAVGYTVFRESAKSPSSKFMIDPDKGIAIEYAIWWDWDIQHLYELEHCWVYLDVNEQVIKVEASAHGSLLPMTRNEGSLPLEDGRITIYSESGKHGFASEREGLISRAERTNLSCGEEAGDGGILTSNLFGAVAFGNPTEEEHQLANRYMQNLAFIPTYDFSNLFDLRTIPFLTWEQLAEWIPRRIIWWRGELQRIFG